MSKIKEKRIRNFTFKVDIDYFIRKHVAETGETLTVQKMQNYRKLEIQELNSNYLGFCKKFAKQSFHILHNEDSHFDEKTQQFILDDWHFHFVFLAKNPATEMQWRERLLAQGITLTDANRTRKDFDELKKKNLAKAVAYLIHRTPKSIADGKHAYSQDAIYLFNVSIKELKALLIKGGSVKQVKNNDDLQLQIYDKCAVMIRQGATLDDIREVTTRFFGNEEEQAEFEKQFRTSLEKERQEYMQQLYRRMQFSSRGFNLFYITGLGGVGKSVFARNLSYYFSGNRKTVHTIAIAGKHKTPDALSNYTDQLVSVAHEFSPTAMGVKEFETFVDPNIYPNLNSRNVDKPYFSQALLIANALPAQNFMYNLLYDDPDFLRFGNNPQVYEWCTSIFNYQTKHEESFSFPSTYNAFYNTFATETVEKQLNVLVNHWNLQGANAFFSDWWQIMRRFSYIIELTKLENTEYGVNIVVKRLNSKGMKKIEGSNYRAFYENIDLNFHFQPVFSAKCYNIVDDNQIHPILREMLKTLQRYGLQIKSDLPKLETTADLAEKFGDDGSVQTVSNNKFDIDKSLIELEKIVNPDIEETIEKNRKNQNKKKEETNHD